MTKNTNKQQGHVFFRLSSIAWLISRLAILLVLSWSQMALAQATFSNLTSDIATGQVAAGATVWGGISGSVKAASGAAGDTVMTVQLIDNGVVVDTATFTPQMGSDGETPLNVSRNFYLRVALGAGTHDLSVGAITYQGLVGSSPHYIVPITVSAALYDDA